MEDQRVRQFAHDLANQLTHALGHLELIPASRQCPHSEAAIRGLAEATLILEALRQELSAVAETLEMKEYAPSDLIMHIIGTVTRLGMPVRSEGTWMNPSPGFVYANENHVTRIIQNLVQNARDAGAIQLQVRQKWSDTSLMVAILDDGKGMSPERLRRIGLPYLGDDGASHGEGCQIVRSLCTEMGASVYWESIEGLGTKVTLLWDGFILQRDADRSGSTGP